MLRQCMATKITLTLEEGWGGGVASWAPGVALATCYLLNGPRWELGNSIRTSRELYSLSFQLLQYNSGNLLHYPTQIVSSFPFRSPVQQDFVSQCVWGFEPQASIKNKCLSYMSHYKNNVYRNSSYHIKKYLHQTHWQELLYKATSQVVVYSETQKYSFWIMRSFSKLVKCHFVGDS